jgi:hypothetical protein
MFNNLSEDEFKKKCVRDYTSKTMYMCDSNTRQSDINEFLILLNYSFLVRNNFFCKEFNIKLIRNVYNAYNKMKTNIFDKECYDLFKNIKRMDLKVCKFICDNFVNDYKNICMDKDNIMILQNISHDGIKRFGKFVGDRINEMIELNN